MKKILMVIYNPKEKSKKEEYVNTYIEEAKNKGHEVRVIDVNALNINYLKMDNYEDYNYAGPAEFKGIQEDFLWADQYVFVYPIWYLMIPPKLMDFMTQVFGPIAAEMTEKGPKPLLKGKTAVIMQSYSMPLFYMKYFCSDVPLKWWKTTLTKWCGPKIIKRFDFDMIDEVNEKRRVKWLKEIKNFISKL